MKSTSGRVFRSLAALALFAGLLIPSGSGAQTAVSTLLGTWNAAPGTPFRTVSQVTIAAAGSGYSIHIEAPCSPSPCDWGTRSLAIYAPGPGVSVGKIGMATFNQGFVSRTVIVAAEDAVAPFLRVQVYSRFTPAGANGRSNYVTAQTLHP